MQEIIQGIATVGFPAACCAFLLWQNAQQEKYDREQQEKLRKVIEDNTRSINELSALVRDLVR